MPYAFSCTLFLNVKYKCLKNEVNITFGSKLYIQIDKSILSNFYYGINHSSLKGNSFSFINYKNKSFVEFNLNKFLVFQSSKLKKPKIFHKILKNPSKMKKKE